MFNMAASRLTWRQKNQHGGKILNMASIFSYMAVFSLTWQAFYTTWRVSGQHEGEKPNRASGGGDFGCIIFS